MVMLPDKVRGGDFHSIGCSNKVIADIKETPKLIEKEIRPLAAAKKLVAIMPKATAGGVV
jgi:hypothetical protein